MGCVGLSQWREPPMVGVSVESGAVESVVVEAGWGWMVVGSVVFMESCDKSTHSKGWLVWGLTLFAWL